MTHEKTQNSKGKTLADPLRFRRPGNGLIAPAIESF
ncbi:hypothetical protein PR003_g24722 [Phytophthora rubi]|uniref:Uncharacterized protein n=1 Tax=Phytophthora rubi TaxID=129364 RepID=A0A6A4CKI2_9STRA|nr:hypothetical protein PR001_g27082 [Phytophthora rubi]KAE8981640.1 hypothetical protein PR002_g23765 [Phytophthora rubi]KAE9292562.1 hypothetical protein PR003_g24722 [Phytophthora rubi]